MLKNLNTDYQYLIRITIPATVPFREFFTNKGIFYVKTLLPMAMHLTVSAAAFPGSQT